MEGLQFVILRERKELKEKAAQWFHEKWGVPKEAYLECMDAYLSGETEFGWYLCMDGDRIVGGLGVIENDFHDRKDLAPNVCAVYTEEEYRSRGIAGKLLNLVVEDQRAHGVSPLYLVTDHTGFYERYGWVPLMMTHSPLSLRQTIAIRSASGSEAITRSAPSLVPSFIPRVMASAFSGFGLTTVGKLPSITICSGTTWMFWKPQLRRHIGTI